MMQFPRQRNSGKNESRMAPKTPTKRSCTRKAGKKLG